MIPMQAVLLGDNHSRPRMDEQNFNKNNTQSMIQEDQKKGSEYSQFVIGTVSET